MYITKSEVLKILAHMVNKDIVTVNVKLDGHGLNSIKLDE